MQRFTLGWVFFVAFTHAFPSAAAESDPGTLESGTRVRVTLRNGSVMIGRLQSLDEDRLRIQTEGESIITSAERAGVTKVEMSLGKRSKGRAALKGALISAGIVTAVCALDRVGEEISYFTPSNTSLCVLGGAAWAGIGAAIGAGIAGTERWRPVPTAGIRVGLIAGPGRGVGLRVSVGF